MKNCTFVLPVNKAKGNTELNDTIDMIAELPMEACHLVIIGDEGEAFFVSTKDGNRSITIVEHPGNVIDGPVLDAKIDIGLQFVDTDYCIICLTPEISEETIAEYFELVNDAGDSFDYAACDGNTLFFNKGVTKKYLEWTENGDREFESIAHKNLEFCLNFKAFGEL